LTRFAYKFEKNFDKKDIIDSLAKYGIAVIEGFLDESQLTKLKNECTLLLDANDQDRIEKNKSVMQKVTFSKLDKEKFPSVSSLPKNEFFNFVAKDFFNPFSYEPHSVYIHKDVNRIDFNAAWHQDPSTAVKFYFYLNDVGVKNGAFKYNIGSHREGFYRLMYKRHTGDYFPTFGIPEEELLNAEDVEASAGSLFIFNPAGTHSAGQIEEGLERFVIRLHFTTVRSTSIMKRGWHRLWRTGLNPVKPLISRDELYNTKHKSKDFHLNEMKNHV